MKEQQLLRDANMQPTSEIIAQGLGAANHAYIKFIEGLKNHEVQLNWRYYNDGKAWLGKALHKWTTVRGTQKEKTVFWLSIWEGCFKVTFYISERLRADVLDLSLGCETKKMIESSKQIGKLKFFPLIFVVSSDELLDEIYTLIDFMITIK